MTANRRSPLRPLRAIAFICALIAAGGIIPTLNAQVAQPTDHCNTRSDLLFWEGNHIRYCVKWKAPVQRKDETEDEYSYHLWKYAQYINGVSDAIDLRIAAETILAISVSSGQYSLVLATMEEKVEKLCQKDLCAVVKFTGFPPAVITDRQGLLSFINVASSRSIFDHSDMSDIATTATRLVQIQHAITMLRTGNYIPDEEIAFDNL